VAHPKPCCPCLYSPQVMPQVVLPEALGRFRPIKSSSCANSRKPTTYLFLIPHWCPSHVHSVDCIPYFFFRTSHPTPFWTPFRIERGRSIQK
jgi:hypothetical protein